MRLHNGVGRTGSVVQEGQHRGALVQVQPHVAVRLWRVDEASAECGERLLKVTAGLVGQGLQHPDLSHTAVPPSLHRRGCSRSRRPSTPRVGTAALSI